TGCSAPSRYSNYSPNYALAYGSYYGANPAFTPPPPAEPGHFADPGALGAAGSLGNLSTGAYRGRVPAPYVPGSRFSGRVYAGVGGGHWVKSKTDDGEIVTLEDGSVWLIDVLDRIDTALWLPITDITVVETTGGYLLINTDDGEKASASLVSQ